MQSAVATVGLPALLPQLSHGRAQPGSAPRRRRRCCCCCRGNWMRNMSSLSSSVAAAAAAAARPSADIKQASG